MRLKNLVIHHVSKRPWPAYPKGPLEWVICYEYKGEWKPKTHRLIDMMKKQLGFNMLELLITMVVASILLIGANAIFGNAGIECRADGARPGYVTRARIANAIGKLGEVNLKIQRFELSHNRFPVSLDELNLSTPTDPWGNEYVFLSFKDVNGNGPKRKYKSQVPVNKYYDVYSMGPDGKTATPMVSQPGCDDILIAGDGYYVGVAYWYNN